MTEARVVRCSGHPVMLAESLVGTGQLFLLVLIDIGGTEAVGTMLHRNSATFMQGILQPLSQSGITFATPDNVCATPTTVGQAILIDQMLKWLSGNGYSGARMGEIG